MRNATIWYKRRIAVSHQPYFMMRLLVSRSAVSDERSLAAIGTTITVGELSCVVADDARPFAQRGQDQFQRRPPHRRPDVAEQEIDRTADVAQRLAQIAFAQIDPLGQSRLREMPARRSSFRRLILC